MPLLGDDEMQQYESPQNDDDKNGISYAVAKKIDVMISSGKQKILSKKEFEKVAGVNI